MKTNHFNLNLLIVFLCLGFSFISFSCQGDEDIPEPDISDLRVDLRAQQTPVKNQSARGSCTSFASVAAVEAAYKRFGYGDLDLSEEFLAYAGKMFWLERDWSIVESRGEDGIETQVGGRSGGGAELFMKMMVDGGLRIPEESKMPFISNEPAYSWHPQYLPFPDPPGIKQKRYNDFNLDNEILKKSMLHSDKFYSALLGKYFSYESGKARDTDFIESILREKQEVVWDFLGNVLENTDIWIPVPEGTPGSRVMAHSMLIVGFDRTSADPDRHYFLVKNSHGTTNTHTGDPDHLTYISYDMVRQYGQVMSYIIAPRTNITSWKELQMIGRYSLVLDGKEGILDIYHLPGMFKPEFLFGIADKRFGSLYIDGEKYKVNGSIEGNKLTFYIDPSDKNMRYDKLSGKKFEYYYGETDLLAGFHTEPGGIEKFGGYARKEGVYTQGTQTPRPFSVQSFQFSEWKLIIKEETGTLKLNEYQQNTEEFSGIFTFNGTIYFQAHAKFLDNEFNHLKIWIDDPGGSEPPFVLDVIHLNHYTGTMAGSAAIQNVSEREPCILYRTN